jgi:hypothetical protein
MKSKFFVLSFLIAALIILSIPISSFAQDTTYCPGASYGLPGLLRKLIEGDTLANGQRKNINRVYRLERGAIYWWDATLDMNFPAKIVADADNLANPKAPPVIAPYILQDGKSPANYINHRKGELVLKNIYFQHWRPDQKQAGWDAIVTSNPDSVRITISGCVFDGSMANQISVNGKWCKIFITDCFFKNGIHPGGAFFGGGAFHASANPHDTLIFTNNTQFCSSGYFCLSHNAVHKYTLFEHNTLFINAVNVLHEYASVNTYIKNNIIYCGEAIGCTEQQRVEEWFDTKGGKSGLISIDTLDKTIPTFDPTITEAKRKLVVESNVYFWPQAVKDIWVKDTLYPTTWMNTRTQSMFANKTTWPGLKDINNKEQDPGFNADVMKQVPLFAKYVDLVQTGKQTDFQYVYNPRGDLFTVVWPLTEKFNYTSNLLGSDGLPIGDLNWYPDKRKLYQWTVGVEKINEVTPVNYSLSQNYPNPFNPSTKIKFSIPVAGNVTLKVYNMLGQELVTLVNENLKAGNYERSFNASSLSSGMYLYTLKANNTTITNKMMLMK